MAGVMTQEPGQMAALHQQMEVVDTGCGLPLLALDHQQVLSAWEKMGGEVDADPTFAGGSGMSPDLSYWNCIRQDAQNGLLARRFKHRANGQENQIWPIAADAPQLVLQRTGAPGDVPNCNGKGNVGGLLNGSDRVVKGLLGEDVGGWGVAGVGAVNGAAGVEPEAWPSERLVDLVVGATGTPLENSETKPVINEAMMEAVNGLSRVNSESSSGLSSYMAASVAMTQGVPKVTVPTAAPVVDSKPQNFLEINQMTSAASSVGYPSSPVVAPSTPFILPFATGIRRVPGSVGGAEGRTRKQCLQRYREKKARRMYSKKIRYELRKINADRRPRIKGRFVKKEELEEYMKQQALVKEKTADPDILEADGTYDSDGVGVST